MLILSWFKERFLSNTSYHSWVTRSATVAFLPSASVEPTHSLRGGVRQHCCTLGAFVCVCSRWARWVAGIDHLHTQTHFHTKFSHWDVERSFSVSLISPDPLLSPTRRSTALRLSLSEGLEGVAISGGSAEENGGQSCTGGPEKALSLAQGGLCWYLDLSTRDYISHRNYHYHAALPWGLPSSSVLWD